MCVYMCMCVHVYKCVFMCVYMRVCVCMYVCVYMCMCMCVCVYTHYNLNVHLVSVSFKEDVLKLLPG